MKTLILLMTLTILSGCAAIDANRIQSRIDSIALQTQRAAETLREAATGAAAYGVPGAGIVALIAGAVGTVAGLYNERRRASRPLKAALAQIVHGVDAAFPEKTDLQKAALSATQDAPTRALVRQLKTASRDSFATAK